MWKVKNRQFGQMSKIENGQFNKTVIFEMSNTDNCRFSQILKCQKLKIINFKCQKFKIVNLVKFSNFKWKKS